MKELEELRSKLKFSKMEMARGLGISVRTYYRWIDGDVTLVKIREGLDRLSSHCAVKIGSEYSIRVNIKHEIIVEK